MSINVDQVLQGLANTLESAMSQKYTDALASSPPGAFDDAADTLKCCSLGATSMAVNLQHWWWVLWSCWSDWLTWHLTRADRSAQTTRMIAGYAITATAFSGARWLSGEKDVRFKSEKHTTREASDDFKSTIYREHIPGLGRLTWVAAIACWSTIPLLAAMKWLPRHRSHQCVPVAISYYRTWKKPRLWRMYQLGFGALGFDQHILVIFGVWTRGDLHKHKIIAHLQNVKNSGQMIATNPPWSPPELVV